MLLCTNRLSSRVSNKPQDVTRDPSPGGPFLVPPSRSLEAYLKLLVETSVDYRMLEDMIRDQALTVTFYHEALCSPPMEARCVPV